MKIKCDSKDLAIAIGTAMRAVPAKTTIPAQECVLIEADGGSIFVTGNDMELGIRTVLEGEVIELGRVAVDAKLMNDIAKKLPVGDAVISSNEIFTLNIKCGRSKFNISGRDPVDFSVLPETEKGTVVEISQAAFKDAVLNSIFCISPNDTNPIMTGEHIDTDGDVMRFTALDGHRIAITEIKLDRPFGKADAIIPGKTLSEVSKLLKDGYMQIEFTQNHVVFDIDGTRIVSRTIYGQYFKIDRFMSNDYTTKVTADAGELLSCIARASVVIDSAEKKPPVIISVTDGIISIDAKTAKGTTNEELEAEKIGEDIRLGMNNRFLIDALDRATSYDDEIEIRFTGPKTPVTITRDGASYRYIVLPVMYKQEA